MSQENGRGEMNFGPEVAYRLWQQSATRMMRANERLMRGMMDVANCQVEFGQTLLQHHLDALRPGQNDGNSPDFARVHVEQYRKQVEHTTAAMRKSVRAIVVCFSETTQELLQDKVIDCNSTRPIGDKPGATPK